MKTIFIKYNPYKVKTEILINESEEIKKNSKLNVNGKRLQEWIDDLPFILYDEFNETQFEVTFCGTDADFDDLLSIANLASENGINLDNGENVLMNIMCVHIPVKGIVDKEKAIKDLFEEIQKGPIEELKTERVNEAFLKASNKDFPVNVIATMSAGKSTFINALLQVPLMPSKAEACTEIITTIKDNDLSKEFSAEVYNKNNDLIDYVDDISLEKMSEYNTNKEVSKINMEGDIPFVSSKDTSLILVDTPGPNNAHDPEHKEVTYRVLHDSSMPLVLYIMNAGSLSVDDDATLLSKVVETMQTGGKQARDRYIFVINKLDTFDDENDSVKSSVAKVKQYLITKGIENPNVYGLSADLALKLRTKFKEYECIYSEDFENICLKKAPSAVQSKFTAALNLKDEDKCLEQYASLPSSVKEKIDEKLKNAVEEGDLFEELLIHTGIVSLEEAISLYVNKYARTAKIKNISDTIEAELSSAKYKTVLEEKLLQKGEEREEILREINLIKNNLNDAELAKKFKEKINSVSFTAEAKNLADKIREEAQSRISAQLGNSDTKLTQNDAKSLLAVFSKFVEGLDLEVKVKLTRIISDNIEETKNELLAAYKEKISSLSKMDNISIQIDPMILMEGKLKMNSIDHMLNDLKKTEQVKVGSEWVENYDKKWYKPWTWFQEDGHYRDIFETREYISQSELSTRFFAPIQKSLKDNVNNAVKYAQEQEEKVKQEFEKLFKKLDEDIKKEIQKLEEKETNEKSVEIEINELQYRKQWLSDMENKLESILEI